MASRYSRRDLARWSLLGAGSVPFAALLAACSDDGAATSAGTSTTNSPTTAPPTTGPATTVPPTVAPTVAPTAPPTTVAVDPNRPWWLQGNFAPVMDEIEATNLEVRGALPPELNGLYVKNSSNPARADSPHWFFGDGMVHGLRLSDGRADWYRNRWVRTEPFIAGRGFGDGPPVGGNNQSNVSALWHGGRLLTSGEVGFPFHLSADDLSTIGALDFGGALPSSFTAHPKIDPATGRMHAFGYGFTPPYLHYYVIEPDGTMSTVEPVELPRGTMMHDFAITETDVVFWDLPVVFDLELAIEMINNPESDTMAFVWRPEAGARVGVMPLGGPASAIRWFELDEPCYVFHSVNAFRRGDEVVVDVCRLASMFDGTESGLGGKQTLRRWTIDTAASRVRDDVVEVDNPGDLPTRDPRRVGREHRYGYLVGERPHPHTVDLGGVIKHDFQSGSRTMWEPGPTRHATEPLFVGGDPADNSDDAGWVLSFVHDDATNESVLAVLDATDVAAGPVAEVVMPQRVPYGFHATWVPQR
mgnify:CR=1 FL=1